MKSLFTPVLGLLACAPALAASAHAVSAPTTATVTTATVEEAQENLPAVIVSAQPEGSALVIQTDPKQARQPIPAMDGADILRTISGFGVVRKGGADGDPVLRGMAGSRLGILLDGGVLLGSCPHRMDPPTAYVFPDAYDRLTVIKGPQSVQYGGGHAAGVVLFDRQPMPADAPAGVSGNASLTAGSHGRADAMLDMRYQSAPWQLRASATHTRADDYAAADGNKVHSAYQRHSEMVSAAYRPDASTLAELSWVHSDGEAAYADRGMDGSQFARYSTGLKLEKKQLSSRLQALRLQLEQQNIDHVMDNYSLRNGTMPAMRMASNPAQRSSSGKLSATLAIADHWLLDIGLDGQQHRHSSRMGMGAMATQMMHTATRQADADISQYGLYAESRWYAGSQRRWISGLRADRWQAQDKRSPMAAVSAGQKRQEWLGSGFVRLEQDFSHADGKGQWYIGPGYTERAPDYWELLGTGKQSASSNSAFGTRSEKTLQLDAGLQAQYGWGGLHLAAFANRVRDYILIDGDRTDVRFGKVPSGMMGGALPQVVRNVQSRSLGLEAGVDYRFSPQWQGEASLAWVRARNLSDDQAMPQIPPLELKLSARYTQGPWQAGVLWRLAAAQTRVAPGKGSIAGLDSSATAGFGVLSVHGSYAIAPQWRLDAGIDNLLNKAYAEHLSKAATPLPGYAASGKIPEPGRTLWLKTAYSF